MSKQTTLLDPIPLRAQFPALQREVNGRTAVYMDGPGGTQSPQSVIDAMGAYLAYGSSNLGGPFDTSRHAVAVNAAARAAMADFLNASPDEIAFGQNMTSMTFSVSRAIARTWRAGDEIVLTRIDHDANISPWLLAAEDRGVTVRWLDINPTDCTLELDKLPELLNEHTRLLAITYASNAVGTINDVAHAVKMAQAVGAWTYVDAVHYAPHGLLDVKALDCDFLVCSVYKFFGPHTGVLYGKREHLENLTAYKVRPAPASGPGKWETGTQSFESLAGVTAAVDYLAGLSTVNGDRRTRLSQAMANINLHETALSERFLRGVTSIPGLKVYGITDIERLDERAPTFAISLEGYTAAELAQRLGTAGIFVWDGHYYAVAVMERLGLLESGGLVRIGFVHYNTSAEVDRLLDTLHALAAEITEIN